MKRQLTFFFVGLLWAGCLSAAQYFVATNATPSGDGSWNNPWMLQTALTNASALKPGDTVWLLAGTYSGAYVGSVNGASNAPITFRNFNHQEAIIDGSLNTGYSGYVWLWGLEVIDSQKTNHPSPYNTVSMNGTGDAIINCLIHDCCIGIAPHGPGLIYGNVLWNCGKNAGEEHGIYVQNELASPIKIVQDNLVGMSSGFGIQAYGTAANLFSMHFLNNVLFENAKFGILFGGGLPVIDGQFISNHCCSFSGSGDIELGYNNGLNSNAVVTGNCLYGKTGIKLRQQFQQLTFTNNIVGCPQQCLEVDASGLTNIQGDIEWDYNQYFKTTFCCNGNYYCALNANYYLGPEWVLATGFDSHSTFDSSGYPAPGHYPPDRVEVRANAYEPKRGHVVVWNFSGANNVAADVSSMLSPGDVYVVRSALNYFAGPLLSNVYSGGMISFPMTNQTPAPFLYYSNTYPYANISSNFNVFIVMGMTANDTPFSLAASPIPMPPYFQLNITGAPGITYQVQRTAALDASSQWSALTNVTLQTANQSLTDSAPAAGQRFYRLMQIPPPTWWLMP